jgi:hypothetical protein
MSKYMRMLTLASAVLFIFLGISACYSACADMDGDGVAETCIGDGTVPEASGPVDTGYYSSSSSSSSERSAPAAQVVHHVSAPSTESMMRSAVAGAVVGSMFDMIMSEPSGPTPAEIEAQRKLEEQQRIIAEQKRQAFLRSNGELKGKLKSHTTYTEDKNITTTNGLALKTIALPAPVVAKSGEVHGDFFGSSSVKPTVGLLREETVAVNNNGMLDRVEYTKLISNPNLTQADRERLYLRTVSRPHNPNDWMVDPEALVEPEPYSDVYLDIAKAAMKGGGKVLLAAGRDEVAKKLSGDNLPYDELMALPGAKESKTKNNAEKTVIVVDFVLTKAPSWTTLVDAAVNAVGAGTREAIIRYRASKDKDHRAPIQAAKKEWDIDHKCMGDWGKAATDRIGAGGYEE